MTYYKVEQINPNDSQFLLISKSAKNGDFVEKDALIFELEGQKAAFEVYAASSGYFFSQFHVGDTITDANNLYALFEDKEEVEHAAQKALETTKASANPVPGLITSRSDCQDNYEETINWNFISNMDARSLVAVIFGGRAYTQAEDVFNCDRNIKLIGYFDDSVSRNGKWLGRVDRRLIEEKWKAGEFRKAFVATGDAHLKSKAMNMLGDIGIPMINVIHQSAIISQSAILGVNVYIGPSVHVGPKAVIGSGCHISSNCSIEHHCVISEGVLMGPGTMLSGGVGIGQNTVLGAGCGVESNVIIGSNAYIPSGFGVTRHVSDGCRLK